MIWNIWKIDLVMNNKYGDEYTNLIEEKL